jgi:threonyl-tRNA synthetase
MPIITLPDGSEKSFDQSVSVFDIAKSIGSGLAKATLVLEAKNPLTFSKYHATNNCIPCRFAS